MGGREGEGGLQLLRMWFGLNGGENQAFCLVPIVLQRTMKIILIKVIWGGPGGGATGSL